MHRRGSWGQRQRAAKRWLRSTGQWQHWRAEKGRGDILGEEVILAFKPIIVLIILRCTASRPPSISTTLGALDVISLLSKHAPPTVQHQHHPSQVAQHCHAAPQERAGGALAIEIACVTVTPPPEPDAKYTCTHLMTVGCDIVI